MMKPRNLLLLVVLMATMLGPGTAFAADEPTTDTTVPDSAPLTLDQDQIDALTAAANGTDDDKSVFEKASDFVTDNAPWFIIGIIVLAAIVAGILIMRGRPRGNKPPKAAKRSKPTGPSGAAGERPASVPSASELRRQKRAAVQRSREEERMRRKAGIEDRKAARRGGAPSAPVTAAAMGATAVTAAGLDPVEAEKQGARDQETAAAAMARFGDAPESPVTPEPAPAYPAQTVPAPVSPSQTAPAYGVVTPDQAPEVQLDPEPAPVDQEVPDESYSTEPFEPEAPAAYEEPASEAESEPDTTYEQAPANEEGTGFAPQDADTSILHEPSIENPGADAAVGNAAQAFLTGGAAGAAGGFAAARASRSDQVEPELSDELEPVIAPEPGMAAEHALADVEPDVTPEPQAEVPVSAEADDRLSAKVAELKASQEPMTPASEIVEVAPPASETALSPGLASVERRLAESSQERDRALRDAEQRLRLVEQRAEEAERRAAFAERLAHLKLEESERERRLNDVVSGIDRAEQRAREAEERAQAAERAAAAALEQTELGAPEPVPVPEADPPPPPAPPTPHAAPPAPAPTTPPPAAAELNAPEHPAPERKGLFSRSGQAPAGNDSDSVNLNSATFEELREAGLSVTQATRILAYRERFGGYDSVEDLEKVPGFPADLIESLQGRLSI